MTSRNALIYLGLLAGAVITLAPFGLGLLTSFTSAQQFATGTPLSLPSPPTLANYSALGDAGFGRALAVTALMTAIITLAQLTFSVLAAYAFARLEFTGRDAMFWIYIATLMVPGTVTVVPLYLMMAELGLRNTFWALVLPFVFGSPLRDLPAARVLSRNPPRRPGQRRPAGRGPTPSTCWCTWCCRPASRSW